MNPLSPLTPLSSGSLAQAIANLLAGGPISPTGIAPSPPPTTSGPPFGGAPFTVGPGAMPRAPFTGGASSVSPTTAAVLRMLSGVAPPAASSPGIVPPGSPAPTPPSWTVSGAPVPTPPLSGTPFAPGFTPPAPPTPAPTTWTVSGAPSSAYGASFPRAPFTPGSMPPSPSFSPLPPGMTGAPGGLRAALANLAGNLGYTPGASTGANALALGKSLGMGALRGGLANYVAVPAGQFGAELSGQAAEDMGREGVDMGNSGGLLAGTGLAGAGAGGAAALLGASGPVGWLTAALAALGNVGTSAYRGRTAGLDQAFNDANIHEALTKNAMVNGLQGAPGSLAEMAHAGMKEANALLNAGNTAGYQARTSQVANDLAAKGLSPSEISMIMSRVTGGGKGGGYGFVNERNMRESMTEPTNGWFDGIGWT